MRFSQFKAIIERITYKPNWTITVDYEPSLGDLPFREPGHGNARVRFQMVVQCAYTGQPDLRVQKVELLSALELGRFEDPEEVCRWVLSHIEALEIHEAREWFRYAGQRPFQPHHDESVIRNFVRETKSA